jgi:hypothetical protein
MWSGAARYSQLIWSQNSGCFRARRMFLAQEAAVDIPMVCGEKHFASLVVYFYSADSQHRARSASQELLSIASVN